MPQLRLENSLVDDRYEVRERLSLGSYAEIFVARDRRRGGEEVVLKALNAHLQGTPEADLERTLIENFQNEAVALDTVRHPHIILRLGHGTAADLNGVPFHYLALEYMPGGDLLKLCRTRPGNALNLQEALFYFKQVCEALAYAHSKGVIHRDLKPNNFLLSRDQKILKVADFGVAKLTSEENAEITRVGADLYAPPEHHPDESRGHVGRLTAAADIYSLAKSFYTVIAGRAPSQFNRKPITSLPENLASQIWAEKLLTVLRRATKENPSDRYATVIEFWSELAGTATAENFARTPIQVEDDATRVRPKIFKEELEVAPANLPAKPQQPNFSSLLNSTGENLVVSSPAVAPPAEKKKIVVNFDNPKVQETPAVVPEKAKPALPRRASSQVPEHDRYLETPIESFMAPMWRRITVAVLAVMFLATLISVYRYAHKQGGASAQPLLNVPNPAKQIFGEQLEVLALDLNVRSGPGPSFDKLGAIPQGSKHKVVSKAENGWVQIEVGDWSPNYEHSPNQKQGWVNGDAKLAKISNRGLW